MKKTAAILLLGVLLFNWCGFRFLASYLEEKDYRVLAVQLDENKYDESQLVSIKVPARHLAYYNTSIEFERVDGQIETGGVRYNFVKRRLYKDSVEMLCIPNYSAMRLNAAKNEFFKLANGLQGQGADKRSSSHPGIYQSFSPDCNVVSGFLSLRRPFCNLEKRLYHFGIGISSRYRLPAEQPPDPSV